MHNLIVDIVTGGGYWGILFLMAMENIFPPIPSELIMGLGGIAVSRGAMNFLPLLAFGTAGSVLGNYVWFWAGHAYGYERLRPFVARWGRWLTMEWEDVESASAFFRKHGPWVVFVARFMPLVRTVISLPAGLAHMPVWKFVLFTAAGSAVWNVALILAGTWLGSTFAHAEEVIGWATIALFAVAVIWYIYRVVTWERR